jgi:hypothetical protein
LKRRLHSKTCKSLEKKNIIMGSDGIENQELLCWQGPAAICPSGKNKNRQHNKSSAYRERLALPLIKEEALFQNT